MGNYSANGDRIAGVLGGLGPAATVDFMARVVAATDAATDQEHIHLLIDHNPGVPNRHQAIAGEAPDIGPELAAMARRLESAGADFLVMACNTAHAYSDAIRAAVSIPFISMIDVVIDALRNHRVRRVGVMAAQGCLQAGLYQDALESAGYEPLLWREQELDRFMALLYRVKAGERGADIRNGMRGLAAGLEAAGADVLIGACTEIPLCLPAEDVSVPLLSSTDLLVERTIRLARNLHQNED